ncbi:hypothetical protein FAEPRAM212_00789 [Faecalibacterium prausnitzii M21/2]|uniref:Uncharacterized protein n=1 Tax=Faecalibacterium prausnitzii M21/2 TaxID=411485 RepID=A8S8K0_9FIRM|nr:hypothetical protein FAEPRAM212_00789 [Faecalibacterium prausnitzii M21/2]
MLQPLCSVLTITAAFNLWKLFCIQTEKTKSKQMTKNSNKIHKKSSKLIYCIFCASLINSH